MIDIVSAPIDTGPIVRSVEDPRAGALVTFAGVVRNRARGKSVTHLFYECYEAMALNELKKIRQRAVQQWPINEMAIVHRVGRMEIGETSVFIAVSSPHRAAAFEACRFAIDRLKTTVPIWKKEHYRDGEIWIEEYAAG